MIEKLHTLWPEIVLFATTCVVMVVGLSKQRQVRDLTAILAGIGLTVAGVLAWTGPQEAAGAMPHLARFGKTLVAGIGVLLLLLSTGTVDREFEYEVEQCERAGRKSVFDAIRSTRAEFYSFFLFSLMGLMLCAGANDLIWLFLALELVSLPTYVMVAISTSTNRSMEAAVKYFFLGALGAATFLFGFALLYGATGTTVLFSIGTDPGIAQVLATQAATGGISDLALAGLLLSIVGICFKIAAVPMHFYTPDVYQGASASMAAFLAFVPKSAGFFSLMLILGTAAQAGAGADGEVSGWVLPEGVRIALWVIAAATMTIGNVLAILQQSVKRMLAYSSIAHSGYMIVGLIAGPADEFRRSGLAAILFYLLCYGVMNLGTFAVLACLERRTASTGLGSHEEIDDIIDLRGLCRTHPVLGWILVLSSVGLLGLPPLLGFMGKLPLFTAGISAGEVTLVVILGVNSAIAAYYYLRLAGAALLEKPSERAADLQTTPYGTRILAGICSAAGVVVLTVITGTLTNAAGTAAEYTVPAEHVRPVAGISAAPQGEADSRARLPH